MTHPAAATLATGVKLASAARSTNEADWGSDRQIDAQNAFFDFVMDHISEEAWRDLEDYCLKATSEEMLEEGMMALTKALSREVAKNP